jgi:hypothetical protein
MSRRPKHYDRPGKRPGPPRVRASGSGGSVTDQRAPAIDDEDDEEAMWFAEGQRLAFGEMSDGAYFAACDDAGIEP